ncbi:hypothetical protein [Clostridium thermarum]|uniref:hypothetical protein n=1 Tax=Clostridium thermarum TaxID=1716543 RepID=UPI00111F4AB5|nr:hypothetical protein [Clostridium thermarum]
MRKSMSIVLTLLVSASIAGCAPRNTARNNDYYRNNIQNTKYSTTQTRYKDGVYTGYSDTTVNGREMARVTIRNGRIVDVDLTTVTNDSKNNANTTGTDRTTTRTSKTTGTGTGIVNTRTITGTGTNTSRVGTGTYNTRNNNGFIINSATRNSNKKAGMKNDYDMNNTKTGTTDNITRRNNTNAANNNITSSPIGTYTPGVGVHSGVGISGINSYDANRLNTQGTLDTNQYGGITRLRSAFTGAILQNQNYDFDINNLGENLTDRTQIDSVRNWQLAVRRALEQAKE